MLKKHRTIDFNSVRLILETFFGLQIPNLTPLVSPTEAIVLSATVLQPRTTGFYDVCVYAKFNEIIFLYNTHLFYLSVFYYPFYILA